MVRRKGSRPASAEQRLKELGIKLPAPPEPFGTYMEAVQTGNPLFLTGMLPTEGHGAKFIGRVGAELKSGNGSRNGPPPRRQQLCRCSSNSQRERLQNGRRLAVDIDSRRLHSNSLQTQESLRSAS